MDAPGADRFALAGRLSLRLGSEVDVVAIDDAPIPLLEERITHGIVAYESQRHLAAASADGA